MPHATSSTAWSSSCISRRGTATIMCSKRHASFVPAAGLYVDNVNLCSEEGWAVFEAHRRFPPDARPPHITECSTPQELETYLKRAGFSEIQIRTEGLFVRVWGHKPQANVR